MTITSIATGGLARALALSFALVLVTTATAAAEPGRRVVRSVTPTELTWHLRLSAGPRLALSGDEGGGGVALRLSPRLHFGRDEGPYVAPALGYQMDASGDRTAHLAILEVGLGVEDTWWAVGWHPRALIGDRQGLAGGLGHGVVAGFFHSMVTAEVGHQVLWTPQGLQHDLRVSLGFDLTWLPRVMIRDDDDWRT